MHRSALHIAPVHRARTEYRVHTPDSPEPENCTHVDRTRFLELVDTALENSAADSRRVGVIHIDLTESVRPVAATATRVGERAQLPERISRHLSAGDVLGILGENDFAVLRTGTTLDIITLTDTITAELGRPGGPVAEGTMSVDIALATHALETGRQLLDRAHISTVSVVPKGPAKPTFARRPFNNALAHRRTG
ncbi:hypothetical protein [Tomitella gaofuii]|uniref:hypothetical protein n=1 Tax=Tomitella gaofuii TaxID=2760083 RepID=UPI0015FE3192|nr:hypothetical protein [Tomitella gaofuii]